MSDYAIGCLFGGIGTALLVHLVDFPALYAPVPIIIGAAFGDLIWKFRRA